MLTTEENVKKIDLIAQRFNSSTYDLLEQIGSGGFGRVYKARHINTGQIVAIKFLSIGDDFDEIKFECIQITEQDVFGNLDSVRVFQITTFQNNNPVNSSINLRFINLSKKNGLLNFTPFYHLVKGNISWTSEEQYNISGFEKKNLKVLVLFHLQLK